MFSDLFGGRGGAGARRGGARSFDMRGPDQRFTLEIDFMTAARGGSTRITMPEGSVLEVRIPEGAHDGQVIRLRGKGGPGSGGGPKGDLILTVSVSKHPVFGRDGDHLTVDLPVTFAEAALGATVAVPTLTGEQVRVKVAPGTPSGRVLRIKGRGVVTPHGTGDLLAKVQVVVPQRLTDAAREALEKLRVDEDGVDPRAELFVRSKE